MSIRILIWSIVATMMVGVGFAQQPKEGAYSCAAESSGGIFYNDQTKKWEGTGFRPLSKFILKIKYARTIAEVDEYAVTITPGGRNDPLLCQSYRTQLVQIDELGLLACRTDFYNYKFNLKAGRFVEAYLIGYINGQDINDDTPLVSGGVCTKIE